MGTVGDVRNLRPFNKMSKEEHLAKARKGGLVKSDRKKTAAKQRWIFKKMKDGGLKNDDVKWIMERVANREVMASDLLKKCDEVYQTCHPMQRAAVINTMNNIGKFIHGERIKSENVNINVKSTAEEAINLIQQYKDTEQKDVGNEDE